MYSPAIRGVVVLLARTDRRYLSQFLDEWIPQGNSPRIRDNKYTWEEKVSVDFAPTAWSKTQSALQIQCVNLIEEIGEIEGYVGLVIASSFISMAQTILNGLEDFLPDSNSLLMPHVDFPSFCQQYISKKNDSLSGITNALMNPLQMKSFNNFSIINVSTRSSSFGVDRFIPIDDSDDDVVVLSGRVVAKFRRTITTVDGRKDYWATELSNYFEDLPFSANSDPSNSKNPFSEVASVKLETADGVIKVDSDFSVRAEDLSETINQFSERIRHVFTALGPFLSLSGGGGGNQQVDDEDWQSNLGASDQSFEQ